MKAFNYDTQEWVEGAEAVRVRIGQLEGELAILKSDRGAAYVRFLQCSDNLQTIIGTVEGQLAELRGGL